MASSTDALPVAVVVSAILPLFTPNMFAPGLGFLMFAVGINLRAQQFLEVFRSPKDLLVGTVGQWVIKPLLGVATAATLVPLLCLPSSIGSGIILVSCVSGAQLSNYATYLMDPALAPLSILLTALSTLTAVVATPMLALLLLGTRLPVDAPGMARSITQIVIVPVTAGLLLNELLPRAVVRLRPFTTFASLLDTCACVGASLSVNAAAARSGLGLAVLLPVIAFHAAAFWSGYALARKTVAGASISLARCISLETGMQSSLLALLLASRFFNDSLISLPCGISVIVMTLGGFALVTFWKRGDRLALEASTP